MGVAQANSFRRPPAAGGLLSSYISFITLCPNVRAATGGANVGQSKRATTFIESHCTEAETGFVPLIVLFLRR